ncbi:hypothetical protein IE53DRAFT_220158 [Violaceomyces palustris]|uniref:Uncharacterized protein n=1 Tax=Violaceomyces palustris TaxID=1673888 RepID=A0ACD0NQB7_9BASI|nr:hypothetical protein IE53DRAFT_220158 [Violaceomyces palustris]
MLLTTVASQSPFHEAGASKIDGKETSDETTSSKNSHLPSSIDFDSMQKSVRLFCDASHSDATMMKVLINRIMPLYYARFSLLIFSPIYKVSASHPLLQYLLHQVSTLDHKKPCEVEAIFLSKCMSLNNDAIRSLKVFSDEPHAGLQTGQVKESLSLFAVLGQTSSPSSLLLLRRWLLFPSTQLHIINDRLDAVESLANPGNRTATEAIRKNLRHATNIQKCLAALEAGSTRINTWQALRKACEDLEAIRESVQSFARGKLLTEINFQDSFHEERICIQPGIDAELDALKHDFAGLPKLLDCVAHEISQRHNTSRPNLNRWEIFRPLCPIER